MSASVLTIALLMAGTQANADATPSASPATAATPATGTPPAAATPTAPASAPKLTVEPEAQAVPPPVVPTIAASPPRMTSPGAAGAPQAPGDIVVVGREKSSADPLQAVNAESFAVIQKADQAIVAPAADVYKKSLPSPVRSGLRNFFTNLHEPIVFINYLLQLKPGKAGETFGRFAINSTIGVAGLMDVAKKKPFHLPARPNGFANTLGYYGIKPGPFFFIPFLGPTTLRDAIGGSVDGLILPVVLGSPFNRPEYAIPVGTLTSLDYRVQYDDELRRLHESADPYATTRDYYLRRRQDQIDQLHSQRWRDAHPRAAPKNSVVRDIIADPTVPDALPGAAAATKPAPEVPPVVATPPPVTAPPPAPPPLMIQPIPPRHP